MDKNEIEKALDEAMELANKVDFCMLKFSAQQRQQYLNKIDYVLKLDPLNCDALYWKALFFENIGDHDNAIGLYKQILQINPSYEMAKESLEDCKMNKRLEIEEKKFVNSQKYTAYEDLRFLEKVPCELLLAVKLIIVIIILFTSFQPLVFSWNDRRVLKIADNYKASQKQKLRQSVHQIPQNAGNFIELTINPESEYNFLTKQEIYAIRKDHVADSLFAVEGYEPNEGVFGRIVDGKPWWNTTPCQPLNYKGDYHEHIEGISKVSTQINNPNALVGLSLPYIEWYTDDNSEFCYGEYGKFSPVSLLYNQKNNLIIAKYKATKKFTKYRSQINGEMLRIPLQLSGLNALDFGYKYVYAFDTKNIKMFYPDESNIAKDVGIFTDYIHLGSSCQYAGGCNNISPTQNDKMFAVYELPAEISMKLWKKQPANKYMKADMYYKIIFEE